jgi:hypothetical protein
MNVYTEDKNKLYISVKLLILCVCYNLATSKSNHILRNLKKFHFSMNENK